MTRTLISALAVATMAGSAAAAPGLISTDRFGYAGVVTRHATLGDALANTGALDTISVTDRDLALFVANGDTEVSDQNIALGSWWYTMDTFFSATEGRAGWGNTTGNTGVGYAQLYDTDSSTDTSLDMSFGAFDGTHYTEFTLNASGENADTANDFSRFSAIDNVNDAGIWHEWNINLTASGLEGMQVSPGVIEAANHPTGVVGSITGIFEITEEQGGDPSNQGFYNINLDLNMINWAWDNRNDLTPNISFDGGDSFSDGTFSDSFFRTVPTPGAAGVLALGALGALRRRR